LLIYVQLLFVFVERDNEEVGEPVANYFGITGQETTVMPCGYWHH
jgi:protein disulfide-isomerase A1